MDAPAPHDTTEARSGHDTRATLGPLGGTVTAPAAKPPAAEPAGSRAVPDARRARRRPPKGTTRVQCYGNALGLGRNIADSLLDLSEADAWLLLRQAVAAGQEIEVNIEGQSGVSAPQVARVVWAVPAEGGLFLVGCEFAKPIPYAALTALARV